MMIIYPLYVFVNIEKHVKHLEMSKYLAMNARYSIRDGISDYKNDCFKNKNGT